MDDVQARVDKALDLANCYGSIDGGHHKMWVIDQMVRALIGDDEHYAAWVKAHCFPDGPDGDEYDWDVGISP